MVTGLPAALSLPQRCLEHRVATNISTLRCLKVVDTFRAHFLS
jgi:hypothetical protein